MTSTVFPPPVVQPRADSSLTASAAWQPLYRIGGIAALTVLALMALQMVVFILWPPPTTVIGWFALYQWSWLVGLLDMDLLMIVDYVLLVLVMLALAAALRRAGPALMAVALTLEVVSASAYLASTAAFEMLALSSRYAAATSAAEQATYLAAGAVMLVGWQGTAFSVGYVLSAIALLLVGVVMLRGGVFSRTTAIAGVLAGVTGLAPASAGAIGLVLSLVSLVPLAVWLLLVGRRLLALGRSAPFPTV